MNEPLIPNEIKEVFKEMFSYPLGKIATVIMAILILVAFLSILKMKPNNLNNVIENVAEDAIIKEIEIIVD